MCWNIEACKSSLDPENKIMNTENEHKTFDGVIKPEISWNSECYAESDN